MSDLLELAKRIPLPGPAGVVEILVLAGLFYFVILFLHGTRGAQVLYGFVFLLVTLIIITNFFELGALNWILQRFSVYLAIAFVVIFQPEIRRALAELGKQPVFAGTSPERNVVDPVVDAVFELAERKIGALVALEREIGMRVIVETGTRLDSDLTPELLASIFYPHTPLHDGGVVIRGGRIAAAGCVFPLSSRTELARTLGTRHRAAVGLTEETDSLVVVVSEETGTVSVAYRGRLSRGMDRERLSRVLGSVMSRGAQAQGTLERIKEQLDLTPKGVAKTEARAAEGDEHAG